jgi:hypothetical protein
MAGKIQKGKVSQPKKFGATLERPKIISDSVRPTEPKMSTFFASLMPPTPTAYYASAGSKELR